MCFAEEHHLLCIWPFQLRCCSSKEILAGLASLSGTRREGKGDEDTKSDENTVFACDKTTQACGFAVLTGSLAALEGWDVSLCLWQGASPGQTGELQNIFLSIPTLWFFTYRICDPAIVAGGWQ